MNEIRRLKILAVVLLIAALRTSIWAWSARDDDILHDPAGPPAVLPELATSGWLALSLLPGIGATRAQALVEARPRLGVPLTLERLALMPGIGEKTAQDIRDWYAQGGLRGTGRHPATRCPMLREAEVRH